MSRLRNAVIASRIIAASAEIGDLALKISSGDFPEMPSQRDPRWRDKVFAGGMLFKTDGCYVCAYTYMAHLAGYMHNPPEAAASLRNAGCFSGAYLNHPERAQSIFQAVRYDGTHQWHRRDADMDIVFAELEKGPIIAEVDWYWPSQVFNQHFVVLLEALADKSDIWIADPYDGSRVRLLQKYAGETWDLARCIYGLRLFRVVGD